MNMNEIEWRRCAEKLSRALQAHGLDQGPAQQTFQTLSQTKPENEPVAWTLIEGLEYIRPLEQHCYNLGFNIGLMGSVLHKGWSGKDLDIVAVPANWRFGAAETTLLVNAKTFLDWIEALAGPESGFQVGDWNKMTVKATYRYGNSHNEQGRLIDWFVSYSSAEGKLL
jgi:hypothetical protein